MVLTSSLGKLNVDQICQILDGVQAKDFETTILFVDFSMAFDSIHRKKN